MFNFMNPTVATILSDVHKLVTRLLDLADTERIKADALHKAAMEHISNRDAAIAHADEAETIANKVKDLISA